MPPRTRVYKAHIIIDNPVHLPLGERLNVVAEQLRREALELGFDLASYSGVRGDGTPEARFLSLKDNVLQYEVSGTWS